MSHGRNNDAARLSTVKSQVHQKLLLFSRHADGLLYAFCVVSRTPKALEVSMK